MLKVTVLDKKDAANCPYRDVIDRIGDKWSLLILSVLEQEPSRFNALKRSIGDISQRVMTATLRNLERDGYIIRTVYPESPPRVEYKLSKLGHSIIVPITALIEWAEINHDLVRQHRVKFDGNRQH